MFNFMCQLDWAIGSTYLVERYLGDLMRVFLVKMNTDTGVPSKAGCLSQAVHLTKSAGGVTRTEGWLSPK